MAGYRVYKDKKSPYWSVDFGTINGQRIRQSAGTQDRAQAEAFAKHRAAELWRQDKLGQQSSVTWDYAVIKWIKANETRPSLEKDKQRLRALSRYFKGQPVAAIDRGMLENAARGISEISPATSNRYISAARAILNYAHAQRWRVDQVSVKRFPEPPHRIRFLIYDEATRLLAELPDYLRAMAAFSLATGLRESNVRLLEWSNVDMARAIAWVHGDQAKAGKSLAVPLNASAINVLKGQHGTHWKWVFPLNGRALYQCNNTAWKSALRRAGISNFRWHDLRHTWASWHVQNGTSLYDLKALGGWASMSMVERYAHMTHERVAAVSGNIDHILAENWQKAEKVAVPKTPKNRMDIGGSGWTRTNDQGIMSPLDEIAMKQKAPLTIIDLRKVNAGRSVPNEVKNDDFPLGTKNELAEKWQKKS